MRASRPSDDLAGHHRSLTAAMRRAGATASETWRVSESEVADVLAAASGREGFHRRPAGLLAHGACRAVRQRELTDVVVPAAEAEKLHRQIVVLVVVPVVVRVSTVAVTVDG